MISLKYNRETKKVEEIPHTAEFDLSQLIVKA